MKASGRRIIHELLLGMGVQLCGNSSSIREAGWVWARMRTSARYSTGFTPFASQVAMSE